VEKGAPEYRDNSWILWSVGAIVLTAVVTVVLVGSLTGNWPWNRGEVEYGGLPEKPAETVTTTGTTLPEDTTVSEDTKENTTPSTQPTEPFTAPTTPNGGNGTGSENMNGGGNGTGTGTGNTPTDPTESTTQPTQPEETEPEQTQPTTKPTEPEEEENEGGGEKPQPGDIDVPIGPRP